MPTPRYDSENLPTEGGAWYRKTALTYMAPVSGPCVVDTQEGPYALPEGWEGFVARDAQGYPYPVSREAHAATYEAVA